MCASKTKSDIEKTTPYYYVAIDFENQILLAKVFDTSAGNDFNKTLKIPKSTNFIDFEQIDLKPYF